jgi:hypothetical protein
VRHCIGAEAFYQRMLNAGVEVRVISIATFTRAPFAASTAAMSLPSVLTIQW